MLSECANAGRTSIRLNKALLMELCFVNDGGWWEECTDPD